MKRQFEDARGNRFEVSSSPAADGAHSVEILRGEGAVRQDARVRRAPGGEWLVEVGGITRTVYLSVGQNDTWISSLSAGDSLSHTVRLKPVEQRRAGRGDANPTAHLRSPMTGRVVVVHVAAGDHVVKGQPLLVVEAMKMEHVIKAPRAAVVLRVACAVGRQVEGGAELVELEPEQA